MLLAIAVGTACAFCGAQATASVTQPFNLFILRAQSSFFDKHNEAHVQTARGGGVKFRRIYVRNIGEGDAPPTRVGFRWGRLRDGNTPARVLPVVKSVRIGKINSGDQKHVESVGVPFPTRNGRYRLLVCANTPKIERPEHPPTNNCLEKRRLVIIDREGLPTPGERVLLSVSPTEGQFGHVAPTTASSPMNFTVRNSGTGSTGPGSAVIQGDEAYAYRIGSNGCAGGLNGPSSCRVSVTYAPPNSRTHYAYLVITFSGGASLTVPLSGDSN
jgi:hypothetical protein